MLVREAESYPLNKVTIEAVIRDMIMSGIVKIVAPTEDVELSLKTGLSSIDILNSETGLSSTIAHIIDLNQGNMQETRTASITSKVITHSVS